MAEPLKNLDPEIAGAFKALRQALDTCATNDRKQVDALASKARTGVNPLSPENARITAQLKTLQEQGEKIISAMNQAYTTLHDAYSSSVRPHENVAVTLHQVYTDTWQAVDKAIDPILTDIEKRTKQTHWKGPGADAYMKQLPNQHAAVTELKQLVGAAGLGVENPALMQQAVFQSMLQLVTGRAEAVKGYAITDTGDHCYQRCAWAEAVLKQASAFVKDTLLTGKDNWRPVLDQHIEGLTSVKTEVLVGDKWPDATSKTSMPTHPKYETPADLPSLPGRGQPANDRGGSQGVDPGGLSGGRPRSGFDGGGGGAGGGGGGSW